MGLFRKTAPESSGEQGDPAEPPLQEGQTVRYPGWVWLENLPGDLSLAPYREDFGDDHVIALPGVKGNPGDKYAVHRPGRLGVWVTKEAMQQSSELPQPTEKPTR